jgi:YbbR domain-containing protein
MERPLKEYVLESFSKNRLLKIISLVIAFLLWGFLVLEKKSEIALSIPIRIENVPEQLVLIEPPPADLRVVVRGSRTQLSSINERSMPYRVDLSGARPGANTFDVIAQKINLPRGLQIVHVSPSQFSLRLAPVINKALQVNVRLQGEPPEGYKVDSYKVEPRVIQITGAKPELEPLRFIDTEPIELSTLRGNVQFEVGLALDRLHIVNVTTNRVNVQIDVSEIMMTRTLKNLTVSLPEDFEAVGRDKIQVKLSGPQNVVKNLTREALQITAEPARRTGRSQAQIQITAPPNVTIDQITPASIEVRAP